MRPSYIIAVGIALAVGGWVLSGQFGGPENAAGEKAAETTKSPAKKVTPLNRVRVRASVAQFRQDELIVLGRTEASRQVELKAETAGRIIALTKKKGERVEKGEVIARLAIDDRRSRLAQAQAVLTQREIEFQASKELSTRNFRSKVKLAETQANLASAKAGLAKIKLDIRRTEIRAPFSGVLDKRAVEGGDYLKVAGPIATIVDLTPILVVGEVTELAVGQLKIGLQTEAKLVTGKTFTGRIRYVAADSSQTTRTFRVEMESDNLDRSVKAGMTAEMRLHLAQVSVHKVSPAVLTLSDQGVVGVKSVNGEGIVEFHPIDLVAEEKDGMWLRGLPERLSVISVGQEFVRVGQRVDAVPENIPVLSELKDVQK